MNLFGPTEAKANSKAIPHKAFIEVAVKDLTSSDLDVNLESLRHDLRHIMEQVILSSSYPKTILTFQVFITRDETQGV